MPNGLRYDSNVETIQTIPCAEKLSLIQKFHEATLEFSRVLESVLAYSKVVDGLAELEESIKRDEYQRLSHVIKNARRESELERHHLNEHIALHGC